MRHGGRGARSFVLIRTLACAPMNRCRLMPWQWRGMATRSLEMEARGGKQRTSGWLPRLKVGRVVFPIKRHMVSGRGRVATTGMGKGEEWHAFRGKSPNGQGGQFFLRF